MKAGTKEYNKEKKRESRQRLRDNGLVAREVWVKAENVERLKKVEQELRN